MNILKGTVTSIKQVDSLMLVFIDVGGHIFNSLILENNQDKWIEIGMNVHILFKETEVMVATNESIVSARNSFISTITDIEKGELLCNISFDFDGYEINSIITNNALFDLECKISSTFRWFIKTNEVTIQKV